MLQYHARKFIGYAGVAVVLMLTLLFLMDVSQRVSGIDFAMTILGAISLNLVTGFAAYIWNNPSDLVSILQGEYTVTALVLKKEKRHIVAAPHSSFPYSDYAAYTEVMSPDVEWAND